jgi:hypothetical protein
MKLTIDTKLDSKEEIRKAIKLLMGIVGGAHEVYSNELPESPQPISPPNIFENPPSNGGGNFMSMFDVPTEAPQTTTLSPEQEKQKDDDIPSLEFY